MFSTCVVLSELKPWPYPPRVPLKLSRFPFVYSSCSLDLSRFRFPVVLISDMFYLLAWLLFSLSWDRQPIDGTKEGWIGSLALILCSLLEIE